LNSIISYLYDPKATELAQKINCSKHCLRDDILYWTTSIYSAIRIHRQLINLCKYVRDYLGQFVWLVSSSQD